MRRWAALGALALLAACTPTYPIAPAPGPTPAPAPPPSPSATPPPAAAPPRAPQQSLIPSRRSANDQCGAAELQRLVGRPRSEVPVPLNPNRQRVACVSCPITQDFDPGRLNFFFDAETGLIREVRCG